MGLGEPLFDKLDADIAYAMMGINAVKGVEIGAGFASVAQRGTQHGDELTPQGFASNNAGGVLGGISTGQDITVSIAIKPTSSIRSPARSIDRTASHRRWKPSAATTPCVGIRATPIAEAMLALVLMDHALRAAPSAATCGPRWRRFRADRLIPRGRAARHRSEPSCARICRTRGLPEKK